MTPEADLALLWAAQPLPRLDGSRTAFIVLDRHLLAGPDQIAADSGVAMISERERLKALFGETHTRLAEVIAACRTANIRVFDCRSSQTGAVDIGTVAMERMATSFFASDLGDQILRNLGIDTLIVAGMHTESAVASTVRDASDRGYKTVVLSDGCVSTCQDLHDHSIVTLGLWYAHVTTVSALLSQL